MANKVQEAVMPKNGRNPYPQIRLVPSTTPRPPRLEGEGFGIGGWIDVLLSEPLLLNLTHLNAAILATLQLGDHVILHIDSLPIEVTTLLGVPIGQVGIDDVVAVRSRHARTGFVVTVQSDPLGCTVEVL